MMSDKFKNIFEAPEFREEFFVAETQARLGELLDRKGISRAELARRLGVSRARVTQIFSDSATNLTLRLLAKSYEALGEEPIIITRREYDRLLRGLAQEEASPTISDRKRRRLHETLPDALIAELMRAIDGEGMEQDRPVRRTDNAKEWAEAGSNVVPLRRTVNGA